MTEGQVFVPVCDFCKDRVGGCATCEPQAFDEAVRDLGIARKQRDSLVAEVRRLRAAAEPSDPRSYVRLWFRPGQLEALTDAQRAELASVALQSDGVWEIRCDRADLVQVRVPLRRVPEWAGRFISEAAELDLVQLNDLDQRYRLADANSYERKLRAFIAKNASTEDHPHCLGCGTHTSPHAPDCELVALLGFAPRLDNDPPEEQPR